MLEPNIDVQPAQAPERMLAQLYAGFLGMFYVGEHVRSRPERLPPLVLLYTGNRQLLKVMWPFNSKFLLAGRPFVIAEKSAEPDQKTRPEANPDLDNFRNALLTLEQERYLTVMRRAYSVGMIARGLERVGHASRDKRQRELNELATSVCGEDSHGEPITVAHLWPVRLNQLYTSDDADIPGLAAKFKRILGRTHYPTILHRLINKFDAECGDVLHASVKKNAGSNEKASQADYRREAKRLVDRLSESIPSHVAEEMLTDLARYTIDWVGTRLGSKPDVTVTAQPGSFHWSHSVYGIGWTPEQEKFWFSDVAEVWKRRWRSEQGISKRIQEEVSVALVDKPLRFLWANQKTSTYFNVGDLVRSVINHLEQSFENGAGTPIVRSIYDNVSLWHVDVLDDGNGFASTDDLLAGLKKHDGVFCTTKSDLAGWCEVSIYAKIGDGKTYYSSANALSYPVEKDFPNQTDDIDWTKIRTLIRFTVSLFPT